MKISELEQKRQQEEKKQANHPKKVEATKPPRRRIPVNTRFPSESFDGDPEELLDESFWSQEKVTNLSRRTFNVSCTVQRL